MKQALRWSAVFTALALVTGTALAQQNWQTSGQSGQSGSYGQNEQYGTTSGSEYGNQQTEQPGWSQQPGQQSWSSQSGSQPYGNQQFSPQENWNTSGQQGVRSNRFHDVKRLLGQEVEDQQGQTIGHIKDLVFNTQKGEIMAVVGIGNRQNALVPAQCLRIRSSGGTTEITLNGSKQTLENGPTVQNGQWLQRLNNRPGFAQQVYSHFNVQPSSAMGGSGASSYSGTGQSNSRQPGESWQQRQNSQQRQNWRQQSSPADQDFDQDQQ
jgi:sporulation protein YlmC with PRC-barrel domain